MNKEIELKPCPSPECEDIDMEIYCTKCGACGIEGCCPPDKCKCLYGEEYKATYKELLDENEQLRAEVDRLRDGYAEAIGNIEEWAAYADEYFQEKWDLQGCLAKHKAALQHNEVTK